MTPIYVLIGIDMETDVGSFTPFYEGVQHGAPRLLELFGQKGIKGTFFFTGDCARKNKDIARLVAQSDNEVGSHSLFHETVGDPLFPIPGVEPLLPHEVQPRLKLSTEWVAEASGIQPVSFRAPRLWSSTAVVNALEDLGYVADASYPMYFYREQFAPYHPSRQDWRKEGDSPVLEIPNFADMTMESKDPGLERDRDQWPLFRTEGAAYLL
jgi:peptidoglycan/xylan/chitin deacetylase (PgdA/CDA1 family)